MPSIRRSLITYFLILFGLALGGVGLLIDRFATDMMHAREESEATRIDQAYQVKCQDSRRKFDEELENLAMNLGRDLRSKYVMLSFRDRGVGERGPGDRSDSDFRRFIYGMMAVGGSSFSQITTVSSDNPGGSRSLLFWVYWRNQSDEYVRRMFAAEADALPKYYQFQFPRPRRVLVTSQPGNELPPFAIEKYNQNPTFTRDYDWVAVNDVPVRRIIYKSYLVGGPPRGALPEPSRLLGFPAVIGGVVPPLPPALHDRSYDPLPFLYVQVARPKEELDNLLNEHEKQRTTELAGLSKETQNAISQLRSRILFIGLLFLIAVPTGAWLLVGRGVAPLSKLSDAVSQVSERDFRLPMLQADLSYELVPIHARLTQTLEALRRAFEREKQAVADISHELRTPIAALTTTLDVSLRKPRTAEQYKETLQECRDISKQLSRLVERIMTLAWLDAGQDRTVFEAVDASDLVAGCAVIIRPLAEARGLTFTSSIEPDVEIQTDPNKLREILMNLLHNAVEYNSPNGSVELSVTTTPTAAVFEVHDRGIGMSPDVRDKIFERFFRADPSRHTTGVHAGLGLAIVKEYVDRLGGTIRVESTPNLGSTFQVSIPFHSPQSNSTHEKLNIQKDYLSETFTNPSTSRSPDFSITTPTR